MLRRKFIWLFFLLAIAGIVVGCLYLSTSWQEEEPKGTLVTIWNQEAAAV